MRLEERVKRGAKLLDEKRPGWVEDINLRRLEMADGTRCILGQLYGWFDIGIWTLALGDWGSGCGFNADIDFKEYESLNQLWRDLIMRRREGTCPTTTPES